MDQDHLPENLQECLHYLEQELEPDQVETIKNHSEEDLSLLHFGLGMWIRNNLGLWEGSKLAEWFYER